MLKQELIQLLEEKMDLLIDHVNQQSDEKFAVQQVEGKWSNGEHLEHLRKTTRAVNKAMKIPKLILKAKFGKNNRDERTYEGTQTKYKTKLAETGAKAPAEYSADKISNKDKERIVSWYTQEIETMKGAVNKLSEKQLSQLVIPHPLIGKLTFREFVYFTAIHSDHHLALMKRDNT